MSHLFSINNTQTKYMLLGLLPIFIWSFVAAIVKYVSLPDEGIYIAFYAIFFGAIFSFIFTYYRDKEFISTNIKTIKSNPKLYLLITFAGLLVCGHYFSIYYVFSTDYVVQGNIINYMWPLASVFLSKLFIPEKNKHSKTSDIIFVFMAFVGAVLIVSGEELSVDFISNPTMLTLSIFSALCAAGYFTLSKKIKEKIEGSITHFSLPLLIAIIILSILFFIFPQVLAVRLEVLILGLILGIFSIFLANTIWIIASHESNNHAFSSIAYLVPAFSTGAIIYFNNESYNTYLFSGLGLIIVSNILIHFNKEIVHAVNICFATIILYSGINLLVAPIDSIQNTSIISIMATVFSFFAAFLLNRVWNQKKDEEMVLFSLLDDINKFTQKANLKQQEKEYIFKDLRDKLVNQDYSFNINHYITTLYKQYDYTSSKKTFKLMRQLYLVKTPSISFPEFLIMILLSSISAIYVVLYRDSTIMGDLMSIVFASSISYITYILYDFDRNGLLNRNRLVSLVQNVEYFETKNLKREQLIPNILSIFLLCCMVIICSFVILKDIT